MEECEEADEDCYKGNREMQEIESSIEKSILASKDPFLFVS
jgi:hypothetical protein